MKVKLLLRPGPRVKKQKGKNRRLALAAAALLTPASFSAFVLAAWRLAADMEWTGQFAIADGPFSHWQVWLLLAIALQTCVVTLNRYGAPSDSAGDTPTS
jgi:hypothetical protein